MACLLHRPRARRHFYDPSFPGNEGAHVELPTWLMLGCVDSTRAAVRRMAWSPALAGSGCNATASSSLLKKNFPSSRLFLQPAAMHPLTGHAWRPAVLLQQPRLCE
jgi:hypothetical protein